MKTQPTDWEKMSASDMTSKELISNVYKQFTQLNISKISSSNKKGQKTYIEFFFKEDIQMSNRHMKTY